MTTVTSTSSRAVSPQLLLVLVLIVLAMIAPFGIYPIFLM